jgi:hypothetical protein
MVRDTLQASVSVSVMIMSYLGHQRAQPFICLRATVPGPSPLVTVTPSSSSTRRAPSLRLSARLPALILSSNSEQSGPLAVTTATGGAPQAGTGSRDDGPGLRVATPLAVLPGVPATVAQPEAASGALVSDSESRSLSLRQLSRSGRVSALVRSPTGSFKLNSELEVPVATAADSEEAGPLAVTGGDVARFPGRGASDGAATRTAFCDVGQQEGHAGVRPQPEAGLPAGISESVAHDGLRRPSRRSSVSLMVTKASVAFVSIDYNQFEAAFLISSVSSSSCLLFERVLGGVTVLGVRCETLASKLVQVQVGHGSSGRITCVHFRASGRS